MQPTLLTSRANPRFKTLKAQLAASGAKRTHTLLLGTKLLEAWEASGGKRLRPIQWLRLEGAGSHPLARRLGVPELELGEALMRDLAEAGSPPPA